ncbi:general odorant-binding protein 45-like [Anopheles marshallii]|uniref:general odorant-binding protein 45-like n=1 Tax=Anopheles marshallii TaxID=1521116 RepID=UPI00237BFD7F|nr:general odorant-binding protein 45-like [Anopheles marshallii]
MCTKRTTGLIALVWLACAMLEANSTPNCTVTTFDEALQECATQLGIPPERLEQEYSLLLFPADRDSMCLVRCIGVLLRFWNDTTGIREATIRQYYQPAPEDHCYQNRTRSCLDALEPSVTDVCERAHRSFLCYHQQYGYLTKADRYIPKTALEMKQIQQDCLDVFGLSPRRLNQYQEGHFPDDPETQCFVRCVGLRTGLYSDRYGPNVDRLYIQCDSCADESVFRERAGECIAAQRRHKLSRCTAAYRTLYQCFRDDQLDLYASITTTKVPTTERPTKSSTNSGPNVIPALSVRETGQPQLHLIPSQIEIILKTLYNGKY